jgi:hypothetical protein
VKREAKRSLSYASLAGSDHVIDKSLKAAVYFERGGGTTDLPRGNTGQVLLEY